VGFRRGRAHVVELEARVSGLRERAERTRPACTRASRTSTRALGQEANWDAAHLQQTAHASFQWCRTKKYIPGEASRAWEAT
jgi:hypothetical protein